MRLFGGTKGGARQKERGAAGSHRKIHAGRGLNLGSGLDACPNSDGVGLSTTSRSEVTPGLHISRTGASSVFAIMVLTSAIGGAKANSTYGKSKNLRFGGPRKTVTAAVDSSDSEDNSDSSSQIENSKRKLSPKKPPLQSAIALTNKKAPANIKASSPSLCLGKARPQSAGEDKLRSMASSSRPVSQPPSSRPSIKKPISSKHHKPMLTEPHLTTKARLALADAPPPSSSPLSSPPPLSRPERKAAHFDEAHASNSRHHPNRKAGLVAQARVQTLLSHEAEDGGSAGNRPRSEGKARKPTGGKTIAEKSSSDCSFKAIAEDLAQLDLSKESKVGIEGLQALLAACAQRSPVDFTKAIVRLRRIERGGVMRVEKAGEASYSEVFRLYDDAVPSSPCSRATSVLKIIPLETGRASTSSRDRDRKKGRTSSSGPSSSSTARGEKVIASSPLDVKREVDITRRLAALADSAARRGGEFVNLLSAEVVTGVYPTVLLDAWDRYDTKMGGSENIRPSESDGAEGQLYCLLHLSDGGEDIETVSLTSWTQALTIFAQTVDLLAQAEEEAEFEHRDLHWGNVLVEKLAAEKDDEPHIVALSWPDLLEVDKSRLRTTIIDYTLSRARLNSSAVATCDLYSQKSLFRGDADEDYQFEVYRLMRKHVRNAARQDEEQGFYPGTNLIWCHYLIRKLLEEKNLKDPAVPAHATARRTSSVRGRTTAGAAGSRSKGKEAERTAHSRLVALKALLEDAVESLRQGVDPSAGRRGNGPVLGSSVQLRKYLEMEWTKR